MFQYRVDDLNMRTALKAVCLIACAAVVNYIFDKVDERLKSRGDKKWDSIQD